MTRTAAHVLVGADELDASLLALRPDIHHHLARVLRLRRGEQVSVTDGDGGSRLCRVVDPDDAVLEPIGDPQRSERLQPRLTIGLALAKADKPELAVQKLTELGIDKIVLFEAERSVVRWDDTKAERNLTRLRSVAVEALQQSRGLYLPTVERSSLASLLTGGGGAVRADQGGRPPSLDTDRVVLIGPEGGWSDAERVGLPDAVALASTVLRAETAAVAAGTIYGALRAGVVRSCR